MKEQLIKLVREGILKEDKNKGFFEIIADHLLSNGVIVLDTSVISPKNRPLISQCFGRPLDEIMVLVQAKDEGRLIVADAVEVSYKERYEYQKEIILKQREEINRQNAEIEDLRARNRRACKCTPKIIRIERAEAIKEFAERLCEDRLSNDPVVIAVKTELKMMQRNGG